MQGTTETVPFRDLPDWALVSREALLSAVQIGRSTLNEMIRQELIPDGRALMGRTKYWKVEQVREIAERFYNGEFRDINIWEKRNAS